MSLEKRIPYAKTKYKISGVYKITLKSGYFYVGCSNSLATRFSWWNHFFVKGGTNIEAPFTKNILECNEGVFEIIELCPVDELKELESYYLDKFKDDKLMVSRKDMAWKPVLQHTIKGVFIKKHLSIGSSAKYNNCKISKIQRVLSGERKSFNGMIFSYVINYQKESSAKANITSLKKARRTILVIDGDNVVSSFKKIIDASKFAKVTRTAISKVLSGRQRTSGGYFFDYGDVY